MKVKRGNDDIKNCYHIIKTSATCIAEMHIVLEQRNSLNPDFNVLREKDVI